MGSNYKDFFELSEDMVMRVRSDPKLREKLESQTIIEKTVTVKMQLFEELLKEEYMPKEELYQRMVNLIERVLNYLIVNYLLIRDAKFTQKLIKSNSPIID